MNPFWFQKTVSQNLQKNTIPISTTTGVLENNVDSINGSLNNIDVIESAPEPELNGNGNSMVPFDVPHNNNGNSNVQVEMTSR